MLTLHAATAQDLMASGTFSIHATASIAEASTFLTDRSHRSDWRGSADQSRGATGAAVVIDDAGHPLGVVTKTDIINYQREKSDRPHGPGHHPVTVRDIMTPATFTVAATATAAAAIQQMIDLNIHHLFVTDATGVVVGMIEPLNVLKKLS